MVTITAVAVGPFRAGRNLPRSRTAPCLARGSSAAATDRIFSGEDKVNAVMHSVHSFYKFTRPHTIIGTALSVCSVSVAAVQGVQGLAWGAQQVQALATALTAALLANVSIVGINQCFDVEIDKVNKPYLPLASGEWSLSLGVAVSVVTGILASTVAVASGSVALMATVLGSIILGVAYSADLPFLRWKKYPLVAASCILVVRAVLVQVGFWKHMELAGLGGNPTTVSSSMVFLALFMVIFSIVIALFKDLPDVRGDQIHGTRTASVRYGKDRIFWACISLLMLDYVLALAYISMACQGMVRTVTLSFQASLAAALFSRAKRTDLNKHADIVASYMFVWKLFYAQYLMFPFIACGQLVL